MHPGDCTRRPAARLVRPLWVGFFAASFALAQQPTPAASPADGAAPAAAKDKDTVGPPAPARRESASMALGLLLAESSKARCWPTTQSPNYEDAFAKGAVVGVGRSEGGFRQIVLPLGPQGFVFKKFTAELKDGKVATKGKGVAFRYRPKSGEPPVASLGDGSELWVVGEQEDWWRVRNPAAECWLPEADVQVFEQPPETMVKAFAELQKTQAGEVDAYLLAIARQKEEAQRDAERGQVLLALQDRLAGELKKAPSEQSFEPLAKATDEFIAQLPETSSARPGAQELKHRIAAQKWVADATVVRDAVPVPPKDLPQPVPEVRDSLERFQAVGFLRWEKGLTGPGQFMVEKGGQRLYLVTCSSGRYDLGLFVGKEVGMIGPRRRPATDSLRVLDVDRIEVLASGR